MSKISIFIEAAGHELWETEANILEEFYNETIREYDLDMEVYIYTSCSGPTYISGHHINVSGDARINWSERTPYILNFIQQHINCEYVVKTNTSTVLNLLRLEELCNSKKFKESSKFYTLHQWFLYSPILTDGIMETLLGKMYLFPKSFIPDILDNWYPSVSEANKVWGDIYEELAPDDIIMSFVWKSLKFEHEVLPDKYLYVFGDQVIDIKDCIAIVVRTPKDMIYEINEDMNELDARYILEPPILKFVISTIKSIQNQSR